jgi:uncharacterized protein
MSNINRRQLLYFLGGIASATALGSGENPLGLSTESAQAQLPRGLSFTPVRLPHPLTVYQNINSFYATGINQGELLSPANISGKEGQFPKASFSVVDDVIVPPEFERYVLVAWGDRVFPNPEEYFGYNCDYTSFVPLDRISGDGLLWVNHEYVSFPISGLAPGTVAGLETFPTTFAGVVGFNLPSGASVSALSPSDRRLLMGEFLYNMGGSVVYLSLTRGQGRYSVSKNPLNRRLHGLSGLGINAQRADTDLRADGTPYKSITKWGNLSYQSGDQNFFVGTGPAAKEVFPLSADGLGNKIIGTGFNCSGGSTPWGTVLTAEENFQGSSAFFIGVTEEVNPNGTQLIDAARTDLDAKGYTVGTSGQEFGQVGEKYGWMAELDPADPSIRKKHSWLGRFRHENIALRVVREKPLVCYLGDDRRGGHTWKFVSKNPVLKDVSSKENSKLFEEGVLYVARFNPDGTGTWVPLLLSTPTNPVSPKAIGSVELAQSGTVSRNANTRFPRRAGIAGQTANGGFFVMTTTNEATAIAGYQGKKLSDFYPNQGALLCDAFAAANLVGGTPGARPEDLEVNPRNYEVIIAYTDGAPGSDGYPDSRIFTVAKYTAALNAEQQSGGLYKIRESSEDGTGTSFTWERFKQAGEDGSVNGAGFANVDNLAYDNDLNIWGVTDMSTGLHNGFLDGPAGTPTAINHTATGNISNFVGVFGANWLFVIPTRGDYAGEVIPFAYGPVRCEMTGPTFIGNRTLIVSVPSMMGQCSPAILNCWHWMVLSLHKGDKSPVAVVGLPILQVHRLEHLALP